MFFVVADFIMMTLGNVLFLQGHDFECQNDTEVVVMNNEGAAF